MSDRRLAEEARQLAAEAAKRGAATTRGASKKWGWVFAIAAIAVGVLAAALWFNQGDPEVGGASASELGLLVVSALGFAGLLVGILAIYFLPSIVAVKREVKTSGGVIVVNIFLGWTLVGWVVALAWAVSGETQT